MNIQDIPYIIYAEETPNPASIKFVANKLLLVSGATADYLSPAEAKDAPIAQNLFQFPIRKTRIRFIELYHGYKTGSCGMGRNSRRITRVSYRLS